MFNSKADRMNDVKARFVVCFSHFLPLKRIGGLERIHLSGNDVNE